MELTKQLRDRRPVHLVMTTPYPPPAVPPQTIVYVNQDTTKWSKVEIVLAVIMDCTRRALTMPLLARNAYWGTRYIQPPLPSTIVIAARARICLCRIHSNVTFVHQIGTRMPKMSIRRAPNVPQTHKRVVPHQMTLQTVVALTISLDQMVGSAQRAQVESTNLCWALLRV